MDTDKMNSSLGRIENLEYQIEKLTAASQDRFFTEYLQKLSGRLLGQRYQVDLLQDELERSYNTYVNRMQAAGIWVPASLETAIYPVKEEQVSKELTPKVQVSGEQASERQISEVQVSREQMLEGQTPEEQMLELQASREQALEGQVSREQGPEGQIQEVQVPRGQTPEEQMLELQASREQVLEVQVSGEQGPEGQVQEVQVPRGQTPEEQMLELQASREQVLEVQVSGEQASERQISEMQVSREQMLEGQASEEQMLELQASREQALEGQVSKEQAAIGQIPKEEPRNVQEPQEKMPQVRNLYVSRNMTPGLYQNQGMIQSQNQFQGVQQNQFQSQNQFQGAQQNQFQHSSNGQARFSGTQLPGPPQMLFQPAKKKNTEFVIGATVLSVIGAGFILAALVMFGMNYMNSFAKGMCQYLVCTVVLLVSELLVYRRLPKLGSVLSAISICGLYLSTVLNYLSLHNFNLWVAFGVVLAVTVAVVLLSRKRDSLLYRIIGLIAGSLCFFMIQDGITDVEFLVVSGLILFLNILFTALPICKCRTGINVFHMTANVLFTLAFIGRAYYCGVSDRFLFVFAVSSTAVMHILLAAQIFYSEKSKKETSVGSDGRRMENSSNVGILVVYGISTFFYALQVNPLVYHMIRDWKSMENAALWVPGISALALGIVGLAAFIVLHVRKRPEKWFVYYYLNIMTFIVYMETDSNLLLYAVLLVLLIISKVLSLWKIKQLKISDAVITVLVCLFVAVGSEPELLLIGVVFSIICLSQWQTFHELVLTAAVSCYIVSRLPASLQLPTVAGILFAGILAFNNVKRWRDGNILVYNALALAVQAGCFLMLASPVYRNAYLTYFSMLIFGLATFIVAFQEKYHMNFRWKNLMLAVFLTYMALIFRTNLPVINSILLMVIALFSVGSGFAQRQKEMRIYGLVLSLLVCGKIVLYDFLEAPTLQKTILFFIVGMIALIIAGIYIILEKKNNESK